MKTIFAGLLVVLFASHVPAKDRDSNNCSRPAVRTCQSCCGQAKCCPGNPCCIPEAPIDIDSLTPEAQSKALYEKKQARLIFNVPEDAYVWLGHQKMEACGAKREYLVQVNEQDAVYKYDFKVDVVRGGRVYYKKSSMNILRAGAIITVNVQSPPVAEGEIPAIVVEVVPVMPGDKAGGSDMGDGDPEVDDNGNTAE